MTQVRAVNSGGQFRNGSCRLAPPGAFKNVVAAHDVKLEFSTKTRNASRVNRRAGAFTLPEVMFAVAILAIMFLANLSAIFFTRIQLAKDKHQAIALDFALHYMELVRSMPFADLRQNVAVNTLYSGANGGPQIMIPASSAWSSLNATNYRTFHPELTWLINQNPEISVNVTTQLVASVIKTKNVALQLRWDAALNKGSKQTVRMDLVRAADL